MHTNITNLKQKSKRIIQVQNQLHFYILFLIIYD